MDSYNLTKQSKKPFIIFGILILAIIGVFLLSLNLGYIRISPFDVLKTFLGMGTDKDALVLFQFRLPRMVIALLIGAGLAVSGAILQGVSQNGLADPGILGINAGAGFAVVLFIFFFKDRLRVSELFPFS